LFKWWNSDRQWTVHQNSRLPSTNTDGLCLFNLHIVSSNNMQPQHNLLNALVGAVHTFMAFIQYQINCLVKTFQCTLKNHFVPINTYTLFQDNEKLTSKPAEVVVLLTCMWEAPRRPRSNISYTEFFRTGGFPKSLPLNMRTAGHSHFLQHSFQFIVSNSSYH